MDIINFYHIIGILADIKHLCLLYTYIGSGNFLLHKKIVRFSKSNLFSGTVDIFSLEPDKRVCNCFTHFTL